jgi:chromosome segregation ATPase
MVGKTGKNDALKTLKERNKQLESEHRESAALIAELKQLVDVFQRRLEETKRAVSDQQHMQRELEHYKKETIILTRALAVSSLEETDVLKDRADSLIDQEGLTEELQRLKEIEKQYQASILRLQEDEAIRQALSQERIQGDFLRRKIESLESLQVSVSEDRDRLQRRCDELEFAITDLRSERRAEREKLEECLRELSGFEAKHNHDSASMELSEKRMRQKIDELETILVQRDVAESALRSELASLRSSLSDLDSEVRSLAVSLASETEANDTLITRLDRVEQEREKLSRELIIVRRRESEKDKEVEEMAKVKILNDELKRTFLTLQHTLVEKENQISSLEHSKQLLRESMSLEIERLSGEVSHMASTSASLSEKYMQVAREKDRIKSVLATETMARLAPIRGINTR